MSKLQILLLSGGESSEHQVSIRSAESIYAAIDQDKYDVDLCYIDKQGCWWLLGDWPASFDNHRGVSMAADLNDGAFFAPSSGRRVSPDVILPVLHGSGGEDGAVQGLAQLMHLPIVGCGIGASSVCWDKVVTKQVLEAVGIKTTPYMIHMSGSSAANYDYIVGRFGSPFFIKPSRSGSSIGVSRVASNSEYESALELALQHDSKVLIEKAVTGRELEVAVLGNPPDHQVSGVGEIKPGQDFYNYEDKYDEGSAAEVIVNADLDVEVKERIRQIAHKAYESLGCRGLARIDFLLGSEGELYINEINTFPGFTSISQYPKLWQAAGMSYDQLIDKLIESAIQPS